jgi:hypothetical protein
MLMCNSGNASSFEELQLAFNQEVVVNRRMAAETAYALAFRYRNEDVDGCRRFDLAKLWAMRAIDLLNEIPSDSLREAASTRSTVGGVPLPDLLHSGVVRHRLADVLH